MSLRFLVFLIAVAGLSSAEGAPRFARIFTDHAVLQQGTELRIWGVGATPGSQLDVRFGVIEVIADIDSQGNWKAMLPSLAANSEGAKLVLIENGVEVAAVADVVTGEVWLAAGQSNMQFQVKAMLKKMPEVQGWIDSADRPNVRYRRIDDAVRKDRDEEATDLSPEGGSWVPMNPETVLQFSAVAAAFAREIETALEVPIGIIDVSWGGKPIEPFIPHEAFATPLLQEIKSLADSDALDLLAQLEGGVIIRNPEGHPGAIFNARMAPVVPYELRGVLWYQAESNAGKGEDPRHYHQKMEALIGGWRSRWGYEALPCYFVQLPSYPPATGWVRMREEQRRSLSIPKTGMAVTIDIQGDDIHPPDKLPVGERLARLALSRTYEKADLISSGPLYQDHEAKGAEIRVRFQHTHGGLMVGDRPGTGPVRETPDAQLRWFEVAGEDGAWHLATARIEENEVIVSSDAVTAPVAVRYACDTKPQGGNLYNRAGLPASPFCSQLEWLPWVNNR